MTLTYSQGITKAEFVAEMQAHRAADHFISGNYFDEEIGKGCAIGCGVETINRRLGLDLEYDSHTGLANALGWPVWLCKMEDRIFEGLPPLGRSTWPVDLATAVPEGVDLGPALNQILARILREVVLPVAGSSAAIVQRVADGCATNWVSDDPVEARRAATTAAVVAATATTDAAAAATAAVVAATATSAAAAYATTATAYATTATATTAATATATTAAADAAAAYATTVVAADAAAYATTVVAADAAAYATTVVAADAAAYAVAARRRQAAAAAAAAADARQKAWLAIAQIVLEEVVKVEKLTATAA